MAVVPSIDDPTLQALCEFLGATDTGLSGTEIGRFLAECRIEDIEPSIKKRHRLFKALRSKQQQDRCANNVLNFIGHAMSPVRFVGEPSRFEVERNKINTVLAFAGLCFNESGGFEACAKANTLSEAEFRASALRKALIARRVHSDVLKYCRAELLVDNYFHAVFEATKSLADKLRQMTSLASDGAELVDGALSFGQTGHPRLAFNSLVTESEKSEQKGLVNLMKGVFGAFRNTTAHAPKIHWTLSEQDALDILTTISFIHRRLDGAIGTRVP